MRYCSNTGVERTPNKSQHTKLTLEKKILPPLLAQCGNLSGNELTGNLSGNIQPQSSQLAEPLWIDPVIENGISARKLISTNKTIKKKKKSAGGE